MSLVLEGHRTNPRVNHRQMTSKSTECQLRSSEVIITIWLKDYSHKARNRCLQDFHPKSDIFFFWPNLDSIPRTSNLKRVLSSGQWLVYSWNRESRSSTAIKLIFLEIYGTFSAHSRRQCFLRTWNLRLVLYWNWKPCFQKPETPDVEDLPNSHSGALNRFARNLKLVQ